MGWARRVDFPLLGVEIPLPAGYVAAEATSTRVRLVRPKSSVVISLYRVEFGNFAGFSASHEKEICQHLRRRLGPGSEVSLSDANLGGHQARRLDGSGKRRGHPWGLLAAWRVSGGQATVVEVLYPAPQAAEAQPYFQQLCQGLVWLRPERG